MKQISPLQSALVLLFPNRSSEGDIIGAGSKNAGFLPLRMFTGLSMK